MELSETAARGIAPAVAALKSAGAKGLVVAGSNDPNVQLVVNACNRELGAFGSTFDLENPWMLGRGDDEAVQALVGDMAAGKV